MCVKILLVDDSATDRKIIQSMLVGYNVLLAEDGLEALRIIESNPDIDLMILDLNMPNMDGFEVLNVLQSDDRFKMLRTIILTNYDELDNEIKGLQFGAVDYIRKPVHMASLRARIDVHVELLYAHRALERRFQEQAVTYEAIFNQMPVGIAISYGKEPNAATTNKYFSINPAFEKLTGRSKEELLLVGWAAITHPDDLNEDMLKYEQLRAGKITGYEMDKRFIRPDGSVVWVHLLTASLALSQSHEFNHIALFRDITESKIIEEKLIESERSKSVLLASLPGMAYRCKYDRNWTMQFASAGCLPLTGYTPDNIINNKDLSFNDLITPEYREALWKEWEYVLSNRLPFKYEYEITTASGERKWVLEMGQGVYNEAGEVEALEGIVLDISERKEMESNLRYINEHDGLTGLYNRDYLETLLKHDARKHAAKKSALLSVNLTAVQALIASHGYHYTQVLIKKAADALAQCCMDPFMLFKTNENQFVLYIRDYEDKKALIDLSESIACKLRLLFISDRVGVGIGILEIEQEFEPNTDLLLRRLLIASERSVNIFDIDFKACFYDKQLEALVNREAEIRQELSRIAISNDDEELFLQFQPILDLKSNTVCAFEALARLKTEKLGLVSPGEFIPIAEKTELIIPIGEKIFIKAFLFLNRLKERGIESVHVTINVSGIQLLSPSFTDRLLELIHEMHVNPHTIGIEITESVFASDYGYMNSIISKLRDAGLYIAIDDFGTGYSSMTRVNELNVNCLKIDKYFIDKILKVNSDKAITRDIISMAHRLGHCTIAEGVELEEQKQYLLENGCDKIQGFLIARPLDEEAAMELMDKQDKILSELLS